MNNQCMPTKDFLRNIVNNLLSENSEKIPSNVLEEIKKRIGYAEAKYKFSIYNGDPRRIIQYLQSDDWEGLVAYLRSFNLHEILKLILERLSNEYSSSCPEVTEVAKKVMADISLVKETQRERITIDIVTNFLKMNGYQTEILENGVLFKDGDIDVKIVIKNGMLSYTMCKEGKARNLDSIIARVNKIKEI